MATDQTLTEYLDNLIERAYVVRTPGQYPKSTRATEESVRYYIENEVTGRPVPIDDSADHFLLMSFHRLREEYLTRPLPVYVEPAPVCGEIPWRNMHVEICNTCKRSNDEPSMFCSAGHLDIRTKMTADQPGKVREISRTIPLRKEDEE